MNGSFSHKLLMACALAMSVPALALIESVTDIEAIECFIQPGCEKNTLVLMNVDSLVLDQLDIIELTDLNITDTIFPELIAQGMRSTAQINLFCIDQLIDKLQANDVIVLGLTTADPVQEDEVLFELAIGIRTSKLTTGFVLDINFENNHNQKVNKNFSKRNLYSLRDGIIFAGEEDIARVITAVLRRIDVFPKQIIFVDTSRELLELLEEEFECFGFDFIGLCVG